MKFPLLAVAATRVCVAATVSALFCVPAAAQQVDYSRLEIKTTDLGHGVYLLGWQGGDSLILVGDDGVLLVDTSVAPMGGKIKAAIAKVSSKPITLIINTHAHADHFGANEAMAKGGATIVAHDNLRERMAKGFTAFNQAIPPSPPAALPTVTYADALTLHFDGETVQLFHPPNAHTDSDTLVRFKRANVQYFISVTAFPGYMWEPTTTKLLAISKMCVFMYVGENDEYRWHDEMKQEAEFLRSKGAVARYTVEKGQPHRLETLAGASASRLFDNFEETKKGCSR